MLNSGSLIALLVYFWVVQSDIFTRSNGSVRCGCKPNCHWAFYTARRRTWRFVCIQTPKYVWKDEDIEKIVMQKRFHNSTSDSLFFLLQCKVLKWHSSMLWVTQRFALSRRRFDTIIPTVNENFFLSFWSSEISPELSRDTLKSHCKGLAEHSEDWHLRYKRNGGHLKPSSCSPTIGVTQPLNPFHEVTRVVPWWIDCCQDYSNTSCQSIVSAFELKQVQTANTGAVGPGWPSPPPVRGDQVASIWSQIRSAKMLDQ